MLNTHLLSNLQVSDQDLSKKINNFCQKLNKLNLQPVAKKLISFDSSSRWTAKQTEAAINLYKLFLCLHFLFPNIELVPTQEIDEVWHTHILLNTCKYIQDCQELYGHILHHQSYIDEADKFQQQDQEKAFAITQFLFKKLFGVDVLAISEFPSVSCLTLPLNQALHKSACLTLPKTYNNPSRN